MCTLAKTKDVTILLDAGVALGPRFRLMPHPLEFKARNDARRRIEEAATTASVVTVSHYHNDHHTPNYPDPVWLGSSPESQERIYRGKTVLVKDSRQKINTAQRRRGWMFKQNAEKLAEKFVAADGRAFEFGRTKVRFPGPYPHGEIDSGLGWVLPCIVERSNEKLLFAPDIQGPVVPETVEFIAKERPDLLILGGPPTYLRGFRVGDEFFEIALRNLERLSTIVETLVIDHHLLRDENWHEFLSPIRESAKKADHRILTASELLKTETTTLEAKRRKLYEESVPSAEFLSWAKLPEAKQAVTPPPLD